MLGSHLARRAVEVGGAALAKGGEHEGDGEPIRHIPTWGFVVFVLTGIAFFVLWLLVSYTLEEVVATLTMIETPMSSVQLGGSANEPLTKSVDADDDATAIPPAESKPKYVTSGIRSTIRHITAQGGFAARWRGFRLFVIYSLLSGVVNRFVSFFVGVPGVSVFLTVVLLSPVHAGWTHAVIAAPDSPRARGVWSRVLGRDSYRHLVVPSLACAAAYFAVAALSFGLSFLAAPRSHEDYEQYSLGDVILRIVLVVFVYLAVSLFVVLPAEVTLARVEASLLPEDEDTVVPFDRTFGGKVEPQDGGVLGFADAWRTFDWAARRRLLMLYVKIFAIAIALWHFVSLVFVLEGTLMLGTSEFKHAAHQGISTIRDLKM